MTKWEIFRAGWRPMMGWVSVIVVFYAFIIHPSLVWYFTITGFKGTLPIINSDALMNLVAIVLGVGAMRTYEKMTKSEEKD